MPYKTTPAPRSTGKFHGEVQNRVAKITRKAVKEHCWRGSLIISEPCSLEALQTKFRMPKNVNTHLPNRNSLPSSVGPLSSERSASNSAMNSNIKCDSNGPPSILVTNSLPPTDCATIDFQFSRAIDGAATPFTFLAIPSGTTIFESEDPLGNIPLQVL